MTNVLLHFRLEFHTYLFVRCIRGVREQFKNLQSLYHELKKNRLYQESKTNKNNVFVNI